LSKLLKGSDTTASAIHKDCCANVIRNETTHNAEHGSRTITNQFGVKKDCLDSRANPGRLATDTSIIASEVQILLEDELEVCHYAAERYANNYHAWTHRIWVLQQHCNVKVHFKYKTLACSHTNDVI
jgi:hypothetical protein